jgi:hypothetical protein
MTQGTLVMVKIRRTVNSEVMRISDGFDAVEWTIDHIVTQRRQGRSVINYSFFTCKLTATAFIIAFVYTNLLSAVTSLTLAQKSTLQVMWFNVLTKARDEGIIFVTPAGDDGRVVIPTKLSLYMS